MQESTGGLAQPGRVPQRAALKQTQTALQHMRRRTLLSRRHATTSSSSSLAVSTPATSAKVMGGVRSSPGLPRRLRLEAEGEFGQARKERTGRGVLPA